MDGLLRTFALIFLVACVSPVMAQGAVHAVYLERLKAANGLQPLGDAPFGERIDLHTGEVLFHQADVVLEGTGPTIRVARTRASQGGFGGFGDWSLDVPRIETLVAKGGTSVGVDWRVEPGSFARCSRFDVPYSMRGHDWQGYALHLGDGEHHALLKRAPEWTARPGLPGEFQAVTVSHVQVGCLAATRNGEPGEGFLAVAPDGTRYRFDWLVGGDVDATRMRATMLATRVEDRFGNWVDYAYDGARLRAIRASDGRAVELEWNGDLVVRVTTHPGSDAPRTWRYEYTGPALVGVVLPDASRWAFDLRATGGPGIALPPGQACTFRASANASTGGSVASTLTAPSGLTGTFVFEPRWHGRSGVPSTCDPEGETVSPMVSRLSLVQRTWAGPGVDARWDYRYGPAAGSALRDACAGAGTCADAQWIDVVAADGTRIRYTTSTAWGALEGKPIRTETFDASDTLLRAERFVYATPEIAPLVARVGDAMRGPAFNAAAFESMVPLRERVITQQGRDFVWRVSDDCNGAPCFDAFGRVRAVVRTGTHSRVDHTTYADHFATWTLGQVASESTTDPLTGATVETLRVDHDPATALPVRRYVRGLLQETRTFFADGTLATQSDGRDTPGFDTTIRYSGWTRGIPTRMSFPGGVRTSAGVEVDGTIRWVAGETGARTCYAYDAVGRLVRTTWPSESQPTRCGTDDWNETIASFEPVATSMPLLAARHWKRTERTGNGVRLTWYDALWRPVLDEKHDTADVAGTRTTTRMAYDAAGRTTFRSYPSSLAVPLLEGVSTQYDALGRQVRTTRTSELGTLASTIDHLDGFRVRATNARGLLGWTPSGPSLADALASSV
jgi:hypothetical protein